MKKIAILAFLVLAVAVVVLLSGHLGRDAKIGFAGIALPSGFIRAPLDFLPEMEGMSMAAYIGSGTAENAFNVFKSAVIDAGWNSIEGEFEIPDAGIPVFEIAGDTIIAAVFYKGNEALAIYVIKVEDQVRVSLMVGPKEAP